MAESDTLKLLTATSALHEKVTEYVAVELAARGYQDVSPSTLTFLEALDCGVNSATQIAGRLRVSRQMVAKTVRELCLAGYLYQQESGGRRKQILFTTQGEVLIATVRQILLDLDEALAGQTRNSNIKTIASALQALTERIPSDL
jgi:DNA-binding MarR family transcriptional regulator